MNLFKLLCTGLLALFSGISWSQGVNFFKYVPETTARSASADRALQSIRTRQHLADTKLGKLDIAAFEGDWISMVLPDGKEIQINRTSGLFKSPRDFSWVGTVRKGGGEVIFTMTDGVLIGNIRLPLTTYTIEPLGEDLYLVSRVVRELIPRPDPDSGPAREPKSQSSPDSSSNKVALAATNSPVVRILIAYTPASSSYFNGATATGVATQALTLLNQALYVFTGYGNAV